MVIDENNEIQCNKINDLALLARASQLSTIGRLACSKENLIYLDITDDYIDCLLPLITMSGVKKPKYFDGEGIGAHISVIYPTEFIMPPTFTKGEQHRFQITGFYSAEIEQKHYFVLGVSAPSLLAIRKLNGLSNELLFKNYRVDLHITIGIQ